MPRIRIEGFESEEIPKEFTSQTRHKIKIELITDTLLFLYGVVKCKNYVLQNNSGFDRGFSDIIFNK